MKKQLSIAGFKPGPLTWKASALTNKLLIQYFVFSPNNVLWVLIESLNNIDWLVRLEPCPLSRAATLPTFVPPPLIIFLCFLNRFDQIETENARLRFQLQENEAQREKLMRSGESRIS